MIPLKIAIVVHGRFHSFDLARALLARGHDVVLFTNYPKWAVAQFDFPKERVRSFWMHGVISRAAWLMKQKIGTPWPEAMLHQMFGRWTSSKLGREKWDCILLWSSVAEESIRANLLRKERAPVFLRRGSSHIRTQARLLEEEERRTGVHQEKPSSWMIAREEREYALADKILVLSSFAYKSFVYEGVAKEKLAILPLAARVEKFRPTPEVVNSRCQRISKGEPLRVLYVGTLSFQKGMCDLEAIVNGVANERFRFMLVGPVTLEVRNLIDRLKGKVELIPKQPQHRLPRSYAVGDVFIFPTIQDGFAQVLAQAQAGALPILTTTNCSGPDLIRVGETGWVFPIRRPDLFIERLKWCDAHRKDLAKMVRRIYEEFEPRDWEDVARDFEMLVTQYRF